MQLTLLVVLVALCGIAIVGSTQHRFQQPPPRDEDEWITQKLDHFNDSDTRTWQMRYVSNSNYFADGGPMFIALGGNWQITRRFLLRGHFHDLAKEHKGYMFYTEHRYYGKSIPTPDLSTDNLKYLNVNQTLADLAHLISTTKADIPALANSKVIMVGASYAGSLVVWFKRLYPELFDGGWASSAPLLAKVNFAEYEVAAGNIIRELAGEQYYNRLQNGTAALAKMFATDRSDEAKTLLNLCDHFDGRKDFDLWSLFALISQKFTDLIREEDEDDIWALFHFKMLEPDDARVVAKYISSYGRRPYQSCVEASYNGIIVDMSNITDFSGIRQWYYQSCNEFGWFPTSDSPNQPFGNMFPIDLFISRCTDLFGQQYTSSYIQKNIDQFNENFGGINPNVGNIFMTYGELEVWRAVGYQTENGTTIIPRRSEWRPRSYGSISYYEDDNVRASKERIAELVRLWV